MQTLVGTSVSDTDPLAGRTIAGRFRVVERIGRGGMGAVYRATQENLGRDVALKVIRADLVTDPEIVQRFEREARAVARLAHPNIVVVHDFGASDDGFLFIAMELLSGETVRQRIAREGPLPVAQALAIARDVASALAESHRMGVVHRDLKPDNVMLVPQAVRGPVAKVLDFGIAKVHSDDGKALTARNLIIGTPGYVAPEVITDARTDDPRADLYALGLLLWEMLVGRAAYAASSPGATMVAQVQRDPARLVDAVEGPVPAPLDALVASLTARAPDARPARAALVVEALDAIAAELRGAPFAQTSRGATPTPTTSSSTLALFPADALSTLPPASVDTQAALEPPAATSSAALPRVAPLSASTSRDGHPRPPVTRLSMLAAALVLALSVGAAFTVATLRAGDARAAAALPELVENAPVALTVARAEVAPIDADVPPPDVSPPPRATPTRAAPTKHPPTKRPPRARRASAPPARVARVDDDDPGRLTSERVHAAIAASLGRASKCTNTNIKWAKSGPGLLVDHCPSYRTVDGTRALRVTVAPDGRVIDARFDDAATGGDRLGACVLASLAEWRFPAFTSDAPVTITQRVSFTPCVPIDGKCVF